MVDYEPSNKIAIGSDPTGFVVLALRIAAGTMASFTLLFLFNNVVTYWHDWPGMTALFAHFDWFGLGPLQPPLVGNAVALGWIQLSSYVGCGVFSIAAVMLSRGRLLRADAALYASFAAYLVRAAFWAVFLVGLTDMLISFLRVEGFLEQFVGQHLTGELGRSIFRGTYVHYPLVAIAFVIAFFLRGLGFIWLTLLVVFAEFQIVISRFVFSYEQAFMGDLVRFWYAALFLFASAYALVTEGHVRVDVFYARFSRRGQAWSNLLGSSFLGLPVCWTILTQGLWSKSSSLNSPLLSFEISQSGFGMYVKYLMAGFLVVFAVTMIMQFVSYILSSVADIRHESDEPVLAVPSASAVASAAAKPQA